MVVSWTNVIFEMLLRKTVGSIWCQFSAGLGRAGDGREALLHRSSPIGASCDGSYSRSDDEVVH